MRQLTLKDFIYYNNPCFSCNSKIYLQFISVHLNKFGVYPTVLRPIIHDNALSLDLKIKYKHTLSITFFPQSNKIITLDHKGLAEYLDNNSLYLKSYCECCASSVESFYLEFNLEKNFIKPINIGKEFLYTSDEINNYQVISDIFSGQSEIFIFKRGDILSKQGFNAKIPLTLLSNLKDKQGLIKKLKTYALFS